MEDLKIALLIDSDNVSAKYIGGILDELTKFGITTYKRIYGDWTRPEMKNWRGELLDNSIVPVQQFANISGKNATDSALIIDAMDILFEDKVDGFCIVSSDSDFTRLASRLREAGKLVVGMGEEKTPEAFRNACSKFVNLENLYEHASEGPIAAVSQTTIESVIASTIRNNENKGKETDLAEIGSRLNKKYPDFDVRTFGYSYLSTFIEDMPRFEITRSNNSMLVSIRDSGLSKQKVVDFIKQSIGEKGAALGINELSNLVYKQFPAFKLKDVGYAQFYKFVQSIDGIAVEADGEGEKTAKLK